MPEKYRQQLVNELMAARRAVRDAKTPAGVRRSRRRVNDAKVALGERGRGWWLPREPLAVEQRIGAAFRALLRSREPRGLVFATDIARIVGGTSWRQLLPVVRACAGRMIDSGALAIAHRGPIAPSKGVIRYGLTPEASQARPKR